MDVIKNSYIFKVWKVIFPVVILFFVYIEGKKLLLQIDFSLTIQKIEQIGIVAFLYLVVLGILSVATMGFYDKIIMKELNIPNKHSWMKSFSFNAYANFFGFGGFAGVGLRTLFYRSYVYKLSLLMKWTTIILPFMLIGLSFLSFYVLFYEWKYPTLLIDYSLLKFPLIIMVMYGPILLIVNLLLKKIRFRVHLFLILVSLLEWVTASIVFIQIAKILRLNINVEFLFFLFIFAAIAGVVSTVPGGLGAFDFIILIGLNYVGIVEEKIVALLLLYRMVYYFIPFILSSFILGSFMTIENKWQLFIPSRDYARRLIHRFSVVFVLLVGIILIIFPVVPTIVHKLKFADQFLSMQIMQISQQMSIIVGLLLLVLARALNDKVRRAYYATFIILLFGVIFSLSKGFQIWETFILIFAILILRLSKMEYYRKSSPYTLWKGIMDGVVLGCLTSLYVIAGMLQIPIIKRYIPNKFHDLFSLHTNELLMDIGIGVFSAVLIAFLILFWRRHKFNFIKSEMKKGQLFPKSSVFIFKDKKFYFYYEKWMDQIFIHMDESFHMDRNGLKQFNDLLDLYGYKCVLINVSKKERQWIEELEYKILERKSTYAFPKETHPMVANFYIHFIEKYKRQA